MSAASSGPAGAAAPDSSPDAAPSATPATAYHRLATLRPAWSRPAKPLLSLGAALLAYVVLSSVVLVTAVLLLAVVPGVNIARGVTSGDPTSPLDVGLALAMGAMWLPAGIVGVRGGAWRPLGTAWSVAARLRPDRSLLLAGAGGGLAVVVLAALAGMLAGAPVIAAGSGASIPQLLLVVLLVLVLAPVQAIGLELSLRGTVMQALGTWLRSPVLPVLAGTAVMLIGRDLTPAVLLPALALGLSAGVLAWKTGGLELPIALTTTLTVLAHLVGAFGAGSGAGAGVGAVGAAAAAPGTSAAALSVPAAAAPEAALAGGITGAIALLALTGLLVVWIGRREGVRLLQPVTRPAGQEAPDPVHI
ncbi:type II CAAX prenyl endopeptidase Rce1 family protein [Brachybacterium sp. sponge]|uniref:CPBP family glutamic-type intramembrane protease n=1 Tax=Brachybacterium sp. sponge TaxID=1775432 RepID=UPI0007A3F1B0|nr:CPBP family glutamic-type intramembrane protease [Brachybacterium sp. sponge]